ncbi:MAG: DUF429 domain-containing protein [Promethearchaeota archaeon]
MHVGLDGCPGGWFAVFLERDGTGGGTGSGSGDEGGNGGRDWAWRLEVFPRVGDLWGELEGGNGKDALAVIDIPIGLLDGNPGVRECDRAAREVLGRPRSSSVFPVPVRAAIYAPDYFRACAINEKATGKRISKQAWNISPKIRELDELLGDVEAARGVFRESHPEVAFWALAGRRPMRHYKKTPEGRAEREAVLREYFPGTPPLLSEALETFSRGEVSADDVLDALALAVTSTGGQSSIRTLPETPPRDARGLPMEIIYRLAK